MSLFEWLGESHNPGPQGSFSFESRTGSGATRGAILTRFALAATMMGVFGLFFAMSSPTRDHALITLGILAAYLVFAYFARPEPDMSNVGWFGGLVDNPMRYSDDYNRFLAILRIVLLPGRFISEATVEMFSLFRHS